MAASPSSFAEALIFEPRESCGFARPEGVRGDVDVKID
jgi:hypothetical protein